MKWRQEFIDGFKCAVGHSKLFMGIVVLVVSSVGAGLMNFAVPLLFKSRGLPVSVYGVVLASFALGQLSATFIFHRLFPEREKNSIPYWTFIVQGMGMAGTLWTENILSVGAAFAIMGLGSGSSQIFLDSFFQRESLIGYRSRIIAFVGALRVMCYITAGVVGAALSWAGAVMLVMAASIITAFSGFVSKVICKSVR